MVIGISIRDILDVAHGDESGNDTIPTACLQ